MAAPEGTGLTEQEIRERVSELAPFHHAVALPYGLSTYVPGPSPRDVDRTRVSNLVRHAWPSLLEACGGSLDRLRVLDAACNCGGFSVEAAKSGAAHVVGFDVVDRYLEQAAFIKEVLGYKNIEFRKLAVEDVSPDTIGTFDVTLCFGILYHLQDPVRSMQALAAVTERVMLVDTDVLRLARRLPRLFSDRPLWQMSIAMPGASRTASTNLWRDGTSCQFNPTPRAVIDLLHFLGFDQVTRLPVTQKGLERRYDDGTRATFLAVRS
jgi:SAM-dependent methyltransferase